MALFLIRHGETDCNAARIVQTPDVPLSTRGMAQAEQLGRRLAAQGVAAILSSDLRRAVMTAERVHLATGAPITFDAGLQERNYGDVRGRAYASLGVDILAPDYEPPGGERWDQFHARVDTMWQRIVAACAVTDGNLAVVTHGLVCHSLALRHLQLSPAQQAPGGWHNASLTVVDAHPPWTVRVVNCTAHLGGTGSPRAGAA
jgi:probable phosphoglycerate mutase